MIQETLDYLLIRNLLACCSSEQIIETIDCKETFSYFVKNVAKIMEQENFIFLTQELLDKVANTIYKYRFDYNKEKEINNNMNYIIDRIRDYKEMSISRKNYIKYSWAKEEWENRELPKKYQDLKTMIKMVVNDGTYIYSMLSSAEFCIQDIVQYLSIINFILNKVTSDLDEDITLYEISLENLNRLKQARLKRHERKMLENTIKRLEDVCNIEKENNNKRLVKSLPQK